MKKEEKREVWLTGPVEGIIPYLQPVAHALLQAKDEVNDVMSNFDEENLWAKPAGMASVAFHLQHLQGVLQRLFTYAKGSSLTPDHLQRLYVEGREDALLGLKDLLDGFNEQVDEAINELKQTTTDELLLPRFIGRAQIPGNILGLYFHAAEHTMRHLGQLLVTAKVVQAT